ncbi:MAG: hypothetical protein AB4058_10600 [Microcystaceae cyanobacterium]
MKPLNIVNNSEEALVLATAQGSTVHLFRETEDTLDPTKDQFDFSLWAKAVKKQMVDSLQRRNQDNVGTRS